MSEEFRVAGQSIPTITTAYGAFLVLWGIIAYVISDFSSGTALIPTGLGTPLLISGILANSKPEKRKLWMHIAATFGLLSALGGTMFFSKLGEPLDLAAVSMLMLLLTGSGFTFICVKSFIHARKMREASQA